MYKVVKSFKAGAHDYEDNIITCVNGRRLNLSKSVGVPMIFVL
jgi:hypothetical protein